MISKLLLIVILVYCTIIAVRAYQCSCECCFGFGCSLLLLSNSIEANECTSESCLAACKGRFYQCTAPSPDYGRAIGKCLSVTTTSTNSPLVGGPYLCECKCCQTGSYSCTPINIGYANAHSCHDGACSIACTRQYPSICVSNQYGQTQGTCVSNVIPSSTVLNGCKRCGCSCYGNTGHHTYEVITTNDCSTCSNACQSIQLGCTFHEIKYCSTL